MGSHHFLARSHLAAEPPFLQEIDKQTLEDRIKCGIILLDKPTGIDSHTITARIKKVLQPWGVKKLGHGGTLDPNASGILPLLVNEATQIEDLLLISPKIYEGTLHFHADITFDRLKLILTEFIGEIYQVPPSRSAVARTLRTRVIYQLEILQLTGRDMRFLVKCDAGTYIRKLAVDIGEASGCGAHLTELRRTKSGEYLIENAVSHETIIQQILRWKELPQETPPPWFITLLSALTSYKWIVVNTDSAKAIANGAPLKAKDVMWVDSMLQKEEPAVVLSEKGILIARGAALHPAETMISEKGGFQMQIFHRYHFL